MSDPSRSRPDERRVVGLMSGTSLDGVDAACCRVVAPPDGDPTEYEVTVESFVERAYDDDLRTRLVEACREGTVEDVLELDVVLGEVFATVARRAWRAAGHGAADVDLIGSHGQTLRHRPEPLDLPGGGSSRATLQVGDGSIVAGHTGVATVSDFRPRDVAAGGHGAPLAPFLDLVAFGAPDRTRAIQNVGGIANCTLLPADPDPGSVRAFDTGPGNAVIDAVVEAVTDGEATYDVDGELAAAGTVEEDLVADRLTAPYFRTDPPKTTGRTRFGREYAAEFLREARERGLDDVDVVASATALTARSIADAYERFAPTYPDEISVCGGGAYNPTLMAALDRATDAPVYRLRELGMAADRKEATLFALLAVTHADGVPNNVPAATGADRRVVMGKRSEP